MQRTLLKQLLASESNKGLRHCTASQDLLDGGTVDEYHVRINSRCTNCIL